MDYQPAKQSIRGFHLLSDIWIKSRAALMTLILASTDFCSFWIFLFVTLTNVDFPFKDYYTKTNVCSQIFHQGRRFKSNGEKKLKEDPHLGIQLYASIQFLFLPNKTKKIPRDACVYFMFYILKLVGILSIDAFNDCGTKLSFLKSLIQ